MFQMQMGSDQDNMLNIADIKSWKIKNAEPNDPPQTITNIHINLVLPNSFYKAFKP